LPLYNHYKIDFFSLIQGSEFEFITLIVVEEDGWPSLACHMLVVERGPMYAFGELVVVEEGIKIVKSLFGGEMMNASHRGVFKRTKRKIKINMKIEIIL
jgi:hypothetical protein